MPTVPADTAEHNTEETVLSTTWHCLTKGRLRVQQRVCQKDIANDALYFARFFADIFKQSLKSLFVASQRSVLSRDC